MGMRCCLGMLPYVVLSSAVAPDPPLPSVMIGDTLVVGSEVRPTVARFAGIPYAAAPSGARRFAPPLPFILNGTHALNATQLGPMCPNPDPVNATNMFGQEDCLTLNVYRPTMKNGSITRLPVYVFIHGGGLTSGGAPVYDLSELSAAGVVCVTIQYRLNAFGFLASPHFPPEFGGNLGLQDQILALRWVQQHIAAFGGDPLRVTIGGQSAGGTSVLLLLAAPAARGLIHAAIAESPWWDGRLLGG